MKISVMKLNVKKLLIGCMVCMLLLMGVNVKDSYAGIRVLRWDLVDAGKHLDWDGNTKYMKQFKEAVNVWNSYKKGVIRRDTIYRIQDVAISDCFEVSSTAGVTGSNGVIRFNKYIMDEFTYNGQKNVCIHELGHALGLEHNTSADIMYMYATQRVKLSHNDKISYDFAYKYVY
jgi:hypothetical protein